MKFIRLLLVFIFAVLFSGFNFNIFTFFDEEQVIFCPSYGYKEGDHWKIPMCIWVYEERGLAEKIIPKIFPILGVITKEEEKNFRARIKYFTVMSIHWSHRLGNINTKFLRLWGNFFQKAHFFHIAIDKCQYLDIFTTD